MPRWLQSIINFFTRKKKPNPPIVDVKPAEPKPVHEDPDTAIPSWYKIALQYEGEHEIRGNRHNQTIVQFFKNAVGKTYSDETAWCAAFVGSCLVEAGFKSTGKLTARSYLDYGKKVTEPEIGDIVVFWRESRNSWKGHVAFYAGMDGDYILAYGGNQDDEVKVKKYHKDRLLGYVRPITPSAPSETPQTDNYVPTAYYDDYKSLLKTYEIRDNKIGTVNWYKNKALAHKDKYVSVENKTGVPWEIIACIHLLECGGDFDEVLHNGEKLKDVNRRGTKLVPKGRGKGKNWTWEEAAIDALELKKRAMPSKWTAINTCYFLERYNGLGYRKRHPSVKSPYLWSFTTAYTKGKYVRDGVFSYSAISQQCGAVPILSVLGYFEGL